MQDRHDALQERGAAPRYDRIFFYVGFLWLAWRQMGAE